MKRLQLASKGSLSRLANAATEAWARQDFPQYFELMQRASRLDPANHGLLLDLGSAYGQRYDYAAAERCFEKGIKVAPDRGNALAMAGTHCRNFGRYELARRYFERAIENPDAPPDTFVKLAELYERFHFINEASQLVDRALKLDADCALALLARARLDRVTGQLEQAEKRIRTLLQKTDSNTWSTRIRGWYELGGILDAQRRYDEAMGAWIEAKAMIRPNASERIATQLEVHARLKGAETDISKTVLERWMQAGESLPRRLRLALLCGHPRSGTTLLEQVLDSHPGIVSAEETNVFFREAYLPLRQGLGETAPTLEGLEAAAPERLTGLRENYARCMEMFQGKAMGERLLIDKNPSLTALVPAFARVFPEARFLIALRDPRDVCLSCFMQPLPLNQISAMFLSLETTIREYASLMGLWVALTPRLPNPWLEVRYEDMVADLEGTSRRVLDFLGVPWDECVLRFDQHARQKLVRSPTYSDVTKPVFKGAVGRWRNYQKYLEPHLENLTPFVRAFGYE